VETAIRKLNEKDASSLQAIKRNISNNYTADVVKQAPFIKNYQRNAVYSGSLVRTGGEGAAGSFKLKAIKISTHPSTADTVETAIRKLNEKDASSLQAVVMYVYSASVSRY